MIQKQGLLIVLIIVFLGCTRNVTNDPTAVAVLPDYYDVFDRVMGRPVANITQTNEIGSSTLLTVYTFESAEVAADMANAIQPNSAVIHYFAPDGSNVRETIEPDVGWRPYWWHVDDTIYLYMGGRYTSREQVEYVGRELGAVTLNAEIEREVIYVRIANDGNVPIETATVDLGGGEAVYTDLFAGKKTGYQSMGEAADSGTILVGINGEVQEIKIEWEGEMLAAGNYTILLTVRDNGTLIPELIPDGYAY